MYFIMVVVLTDEEVVFVERLYRDYEKQMYRVADEVLKNHYDSQDCVHDTIVKIMEYAEPFRVAEKEAYLAQLLIITCRNTALNKYRYIQRQRRFECSMTAYDEQGEHTFMDIPDESADVQKAFERESVCEYLRDAISQLDEAHRDVVVLRGMGYQYDIIAKLMELPEDTVRKRYQRAKKKLLKIGGKQLYEYAHG